MKPNTQANFHHFKIINDYGAFHNSGVMLKLRPKELSLLWLLVKHSNQLVTKELIISEVWNGFAASDASIARCISVIKANLRLASPGSERLIKTEYGRGYRFLGEVNFNEDKCTFDKDSTNEEIITLSSPTTIGEIATRDILSCDPQATLFEVANLLSLYQKSSIVVLSNNKLVGIWTEADALLLDLNDPEILGRCIGDFMQSPAIRLDSNASIATAVSTMRLNNIRHLVVTDHNSEIFGVVSQSDIIYSHGVESFMTVKDVNSIAYQTPLVITENLSISDIVKQMKKCETDILVINLDRLPVFTFTEHDLINLIAKNSINKLIRDVKLPTLVTIKEDTSILVARQLMDIKKIKHLAVLDKNENFVKVLSLSDILADIENSYGQLIEEILEQSKTNHEIDEHTQLLARAMQQTAGMVIITDRYGDIQYVNESFEKNSGYKLNEIRGRNPRLLSSGVISKKVFQEMWETIQSRRTWKGELCNKKKSGEYYWVLSSISPIYDDNQRLHNFIAVEEDITEKKLAETRVLETERRFNEMSQQSHVMNWECDPNGKVVFLDQNWLGFTGRQYEDLIGNGWAELLHPEDLQAFLDVFQKAIIKRSPFCIDHRLQMRCDSHEQESNSL